MSNPDTANSDTYPSSGVPSSFDSSDFFDESRSQKLWRKLRQEPLIPLGCAATCYALYQATKSIRSGDKHQTNRMFRARVYAQGFTLLALVAGSIFYKDERLKRKTYERAEEDKKAVEKRNKWLRELEARDNEDREWRARVEGMHREAQEVSDRAKETLEKGRQGLKKRKDDAKSIIENQFSSKSIREQVSRDGWGPGSWVIRTKEAWKRI